MNKDNDYAGYDLINPNVIIIAVPSDEVVNRIKPLLGKQLIHAQYSDLDYNGKKFIEMHFADVRGQLPTIKPVAR